MKKILPKSNLARTLLLGLVFLFHGVFSSFGQIPTTGQTIEFKNGTPSSGFNYSVGDYYTYTNILPSSGVNIYATVTIVEKNRVDSWSNFDQEGYPNDAQKRNERFQPVINFNTDGYVKFEVDFFESTTDLPVYLNDFNFIGVDIDGDAYYSSNSDRTYGFTEYMQITGYSTYDVQTPTDLTVVESGITLDVIGYYGSYTDGGGSVVVNPEGSFSATYTDAVASFEFIIGIKSFRNSNQYGNNPGSRYFSASIGPNIIQYNFPTPIAADDNNSDVCFPITADTEVLNAYSNDTYRGHDITLGDTIVTNVIQANINLIFNTDNGSVSVKAGTPIGTYILKYQLSTKPGDIPNYGPVKESRIATVTVVVKDCCTQTVSASATDSALCESENLELFATTIDGGSYSWNKDGGSEFSSDQNPIINNVTTADAGLYIVEVTYNGGSCVALDTVSITVYPTYTAVENTAVDTAVCEADMPFNYEGTEFTAAGSKDITFQTVNGCDSIVTVNLTVYPTYTAVENTAVDTAVCEADMPFNYEGTEFTAAGSKDITFQTVNGCDSIVTVNLTVYPTYTAVENTTVDTAVCEADMPFNYEGTEFTAAGSKDITFQTVNGCDSIVTVNLTVYPTYTAVENTAVDTAVCEADMPFNYEGTEFTAAGSKDITFQTVNGCDSIVTVNLTVYPTYTAVENTAVDTAVCEADMPFNYEGTEFTAAGSKDITFQTVNGCDSIVTVNLTVYPTYTAVENTAVDTAVCEADMPFNYEGTEFTAAGSKDITFQTVNGCDSIVTVNLTVYPTYTAVENTAVDTAVCEADMPFNYEGTEFTAAGSKDITFQTVNGCDSIVTVNLTVYPTYTAVENTTVDTAVCEADMPFNYEGTEFTAAGSKDITFQTVNGCDSIVTVNLTVYPTYTAVENTAVDTAVCEADMPFNYEGTEFTAAGSKDITFQTVNGCDSIVTVNLTVYPTYTAVENTAVDTAVCEADMPFNYEGTEFTAAGSKDITFQTVNGCDSIVTVNLTVYPTYTAVENTAVDTAVCEADMPFNYEGTEFTAAGSKDITFQTVNGCDSIVTVNLTVYPTYTAVENTAVDTAVCEADMPFNYEGTEFTAAGSKNITFQTVNGCDSIVTVNLTVYPTYTAVENTAVDTAVCEADMPFNYEGTEFTAAGSKDITFQTVNGCDSIVTVNLTVYPTYTAVENTAVDTAVCEADMPFNYEGTEFTAAGSKDITFQTVNGCDSIVTVNLTVYPTYTAVENTAVDTAVCEADMPFNYEGTEFTAAGSKDITFQTVNGCDSIVTVNLTVYPTYTAVENTAVDTAVCEADMPFNYEGTEFTAAGSKDITFQTVNGCDSIVTVNLTVYPTYTAVENTAVDTAVCEADMPFNYEGTEFTAAGSKDITFQTVNGCDSIVTVNLTVYPTYTAVENTAVDTAVCEADMPFNYEGTEFTAAGSKDITFQTVNGCDSIVTVNLTVYPTYTAVENTAVDTAVCEADMPFNYEGTEFTAAGSKDITFQTVNGCDSIVTVNLTVYPTYTAVENTAVDTAVCEADMPFNYEGTEFTAAGSKDITFQTVNGCDSIVTVNLTVYPTYTAVENTAVDTAVCEADMPFNYEGTEFTAAGSKNITFQTVNGCDSIVTVNLTVYPTYTAVENTAVDTAVCEADMPFNYEGTEFTAAGSKNITFQTVNGCDSIVTVNLTVYPTYTAVENTAVDTAVCEADMPFNYEGTEFTAAGSKDITFQTVNGCDSIVTVNLTVYPTYTAVENTAVDTAVCEADMPFNYEGTEFTAAGSKDITFQTVNGCDSIVTVNLTVYPTYTAVENTAVDTAVCEADMPFNYEGTEFTAAGSKDITFQTVNGCDSIVTVNLTVYPTYTAVENTAVDTAVCEADMPFNYEGTEFTAAGSKDITFQTVNGCDSIVTVNLTVYPTYTAVENTAVDTAVCEADMPFNYEGTEFTAAGSKDITFQTVNGCDSIVTVNLTVYPTYTAVENTAVDTAVCEADMPFNYEGTEFTAAGSKDITFQTVNGCDSIVTVNLTVYPTYTAVENTAVDTAVCEADMPFNYEGTEFTAAGSKDITFQTVNGCDSIVTVNLTVYPTYTAVENTAVDTAVCEADMPFNYEGTEFTAAGSKDITFQTVNGCDSIVTVNLTVYPTYTAVENTAVDTAVCEADMPFNYEGTEFTAAGSKDITFQTVNGCDSIVTVNLTVYPTYTAVENTAVDTAVCEADMPFNYEGTEFTAAGSKDITFQTVNGCDSIVTVNLTVYPTYTAVENTAVDTAVCEADMPFNYEGTEFTAAGSKDITFQTVNGCDSIVTVNLTVYPTYTAVENTAVDTAVCEADMPFNYEGTEFTAAGSKDITFQTVNGCDSIVTVNLTVYPTYTAVENTAVDTAVCEADMPFNYEGTEFTAAGSKDITFQTVNGCDSIVTVNLTVYPTYTAVENTAVDTAVCEADMPFNYEGTEFTAAGSKDITFQTVNGCDSIVTVNLTVYPTYTAVENTAVDTAVCEADMPFNYEGTEFTAAGSKDITFQTVNGCDSIVTVNLTVYPTYTAVENTAVDTAVCEADMPFNYEGTEFTAAGSKDITFQTVNGCDSIVTVNLTVYPTYTAVENTAVDTAVCEADMPFNYEGTEFTAAGSKDITFQTVNGCDSIVTVNLTVYPTYTAVENTAVDTAVCEADMPFNYEGTEFTAAGSKDITFQTVNGCDSIVTVNLTVYPTYTAVENTAVDTAVCEADMPFNYEGTEFTAAGSKDITFQTVNGCDSIVTVNLTVYPTYTAVENTAVDTAVCEADMPFNYEGTEFTAAGSKDITFQTVNGCDSIVTVNLTVYPTYTAVENTAVDTAVCEADMPFNYEGTEFTAAGSKNITFQTVNGCDSIVTVNLTVYPTYTAVENTAVDTAVCEADMPFNYEGTEFTAAGSKNITFQTVNGCDSIVTVNLTVYPTYTAVENTAVDTAVCEADMPFNYEGTEFTAAGSKDITFQTVNGCDSIITVNLTVNPTYSATVDTTICDSELDFTYGDSTWTEAGSKDVVFQTVNGCDSIITVNLTVNPTYSATVDTTICDSELDFTYGDSTWTEAGSKDVVFQTVNGCDSIITVNLTVNPTYSATVDTTICDSELDFTYGDSTWTEAGSKDVVFQTVNGCDSIITVNLTVNYSNTGDTAAVACDSFTWYGETFYADATPTHTFTNAAGCDSIVTLDLTILESTFETIDTTVCDMLTINDSTYDESGTYTQYLENAAGCDSTLTINLTVLESTFETIEEEDCDSVVVNEIPYYTSGTYTQNLTNEAGCDSTLTIVATVNYSSEETINRTVCDEVTINDSTYTESGTFIQNLTNNAGCDSTLTINLIVLESPEDTIDVTACEEYELNGETYTESGTYTQVIESEQGCTGTLTINLTILESTLNVISMVVCDEYTLNGRTYTQTGSYRQYTTNAAGCDSTIILNLTVREDIVELTSEASDLTVECDGLGNTEALENWLATHGTTGAAEAGFGSITWNNDFEALTPGCCNTGSATVTFTATDDCGNSVSTTATFTIVDTTAPTFTAPADITIYSGDDCQYDASVEVTGDVTDESDICCTDLNAEYTEITEQSNCAGEWIITRTWTLADACGNEADPQVQVITVLDNTAPTAVCNDITIQLNENGVASITVADIDGGSTDNCAIDTMFIDKENFYCGGLGVNLVTLTVIDECGNTSTCTASVTVEEGEFDCGVEPFRANPDVLTLIYCPGGTVTGDVDLLANDEGITQENSNFNVLNTLPNGVTITNGALNYVNEDASEAVITLTYSVCHTVNTENCDTAEVTIHILLDTDCDDIPDVDDIDDDDDGLLDIHEQDENKSANADGDIDTDGDGIVDRLDIDSDNDGIVDNIEWQQNIPEGIQYEADGGIDFGFDYYPPLGSDSDKDGWDDQYDDNEQNVYYPAMDMDLDGTPDFQDLDADNDGIADYIEGWDELPYDSIADVDFIGTDSDGDGLDDAYDTYDTSLEWLHGKNAVGSNAPLVDMAADTANNIRDWRDDIERRVIPEEPEAETCDEWNIPDGFSPNGDGYNDLFRIACTIESDAKFEDDYPDAKIEIFNRWGNLVFEQERFGNTSHWGEYDAWWDGTSMHDMQLGKDQLPAANYFYILYFNKDGKEPVTGFVFLNN